MLVNTNLGDFKEGYDVGREISPSSPEYKKPFKHPNIWPNPELLPQNWKEDILDYSDRMMQLGRVLMSIFAVALKLPENWFEDKYDKPMASLRLLHYPPTPEGEPRFGCGAHSDYGGCTIIAQDDAGGLQLLNAAGQWIDIPCEQHTMVVNIADMLQRWTNNTFKSTIHRVLTPPHNRHRFSAPFFFDPNFDTVIECLESCKDPEKGALFPPVVFGDYLLKMYDSTFYVKTGDSTS